MAGCRKSRPTFRPRRLLGLRPLPPLRLSSRTRLRLRQRLKKFAAPRISKSTSRSFRTSRSGKIGEEYENPLIVTGTILFTPLQTAGFITRNVEQYDNLGRRTVVPQRLYMERKGFAIAPKFIFIDGRTGATLHTESTREEVLYNAQQNTPALSSYFELMDKVIPMFLGTLSTQKIRGTRVLLR